MQRTYLIDASVYIFRAWHSIEPRFVDRDGLPVHATWGFAGFLCTVLEQTQATHIAICFDEALESSFRNDLYPAYKANREPAPMELRREFSHCQAIAEALGIPCYSDSRHEADDLIGTLASHSRRAGAPVTILSADKDLAQLLDAGDEWWDFSRNRRLDSQGVADKFGVRPDQIADYLALTGDAVDNIPGVPGIGPKSAALLLRHFDSLEQLLQRSDEVQFLSMRGAKAHARRLKEHADAARLARSLTGIKCDAPLGLSRPSLVRQSSDTDALCDLFDHLRFGNLLRNRCARL